MCLTADQSLTAPRVEEPTASHAGDDERMETLLRHQWIVLRSWLDEVDINRHGERPSGLPEWTVRDLVVHLGYGLAMLEELKPAAPGDEPLSLGAYIARYQPAAPVIAAATRDLAAQLPNALEGIDALAARAWLALDRPLPAVVMGRRGPLTREDFVVTRLLELVVHAEDLHRATAARTTAPVLPEARDVVAAALADAYGLRAGESPASMEPQRWIRLATGRLPSEDPHLPLL